MPVNRDLRVEQHAIHLQPPGFAVVVAPERRIGGDAVHAVAPNIELQLVGYAFEQSIAAEMEMRHTSHEDDIAIDSSPLEPFQERCLEAYPEVLRRDASSPEALLKMRERSQYHVESVQEAIGGQGGCDLPDDGLHERPHLLEKPGLAESEILDVENVGAFLLDLAQE